jgi:3-oxoadipate enol-lactonase
MSRLSGADLRIHREGSGRPVVLLHCLGVDHRFWDYAGIPDGRYSVLRYDLPGHGETPVPDTLFDIEDLAEQLADVLAEERIAKAHVVGISLGGLIAQRFAAAYPERIDRLVLVDTTPCYTDEMRGMWSERAATARTAGVEKLVDGLLAIWFTADALADNGPGVRYVRDALLRASGEGYALACEALARADLRPLLATIRAPTLVVCGDADIPSFIDAAKELQREIRGAQLEWLPKARHAAPIERPEAFGAMLAKFLG